VLGQVEGDQISIIQELIIQSDAPPNKACSGWW